MNVEKLKGIHKTFKDIVEDFGMEDLVAFYKGYIFILNPDNSLYDVINTKWSEKTLNGIHPDEVIPNIVAESHFDFLIRDELPNYYQVDKDTIEKIKTVLYGELGDFLKEYGYEDVAEEIEDSFSLYFELTDTKWTSEVFEWLEKFKCDKLPCSLEDIVKNDYVELNEVLNEDELKEAMKMIEKEEPER